MKKRGKKVLNFMKTLSIVAALLCSTYSGILTQCVVLADGFYQEVRKEGRIYVFTDAKRKADFDQSGELGKGIIKIGYGPGGETVVFDSDEAIIEYQSRRVRQILERLNIKTYRELRKDGRVYVFTSHATMAAFEQSGEPGKGSIIKIGYGPNGETVIFDSSEAIKEYENRYSQK